MELEIYDALVEKFKNIGIKVDYKDIRKYHIIVIVDTEQTEFEYIWDGKFTFDANINVILKTIDQIILKYYHRL